MDEAFRWASEEQRKEENAVGMRLAKFRLLGPGFYDNSIGTSDPLFA